MQNTLNTVIETTREAITAGVEIHAPAVRAEGIGWILIGLVIMIGAVSFWKYFKKNADEHGELFGFTFLTSLVFLVGTLFVGSNVSRVLYPESDALRYTVRSITGN